MSESLTVFYSIQRVNDLIFINQTNNKLINLMIIIMIDMNDMNYSERTFSPFKY